MYMYMYMYMYICKYESEIRRRFVIYINLLLISDSYQDLSFF